MAKILKFPTKDELKHKEQAQQVKDDHAILEETSDECIAASHYLLEIMEEFINTGEVSPQLMDMNFRDETFPESRDMFVIVNLINAMLNRYYFMPHALQREMDRLYAKIKLINQQNEESRVDLEDKYEVLFEPEDGEIEFTFTPEEPEDNDTD
jgi:hypothetical protein